MISIAVLLGVDQAAFSRCSMTAERLTDVASKTLKKLPMSRLRATIAAALFVVPFGMISFERAVYAGAVVLEKPTDQPYGDRRYGVEDPEGHRWYFAQAITHAK
jgi:hypothetical protein